MQEEKVTRARNEQKAKSPAARYQKRTERRRHGRGKRYRVERGVRLKLELSSKARHLLLSLPIPAAGVRSQQTLGVTGTGNRCSK